ncbi:MAG: ankyrin repeat domain-containing protein [Deltaproteobacteria bacterium]|nr:ankyrin repeat domain-containing protein [Deltaproteobacteria bacterium]
MKRIFSVILILILLSGCSSIHGAAKNGDIKTLNELLDQGEDVNKIAGYNATQAAIGVIFTPLTAGIVPLIMVLTWPYDNHDTILGYAAAECQLEAAKLLLEKGADPNKRCDSCRRSAGAPLLQALYAHGDKDCDRKALMQLLLDNGADGKAALEYARRNNQPETVLFIQEGMEKWEKKKAIKELKARMAARRKAIRTVDWIKSNQEEKTGDEAMAAGKPEEALAHYVKALEASPYEGEKDRHLREKLIKAALSIAQRPSIPDKAQEHSARAQAFMKKAQGVEGYEQAIAELEASLLIAPWWAESYFNLGLLLEKAEDYEAAIASLKLYLLASPTATDAAAVKNKIIDLGVAKEMAGKK